MKSIRMSLHVVDEERMPIKRMALMTDLNEGESLEDAVTRAYDSIIKSLRGEPSPIEVRVMEDL